MKLDELQTMITNSTPATNVEVKWCPVGEDTLKALISLANKALRDADYQSLADSVTELERPYVEPLEALNGVLSLVKVELDFDFEILSSNKQQVERLSPKEKTLALARTARPGDEFCAQYGQRIRRYIVFSNDGNTVVGDDMEFDSESLDAFDYNVLHEKKFNITKRAKRKKVKVEQPSTPAAAQPTTKTTIITSVLTSAAVAIVVGMFF